MNIDVSISALCKEIRGVHPLLQFSILEIGAVPSTRKSNEPFHQLLTQFPGSEVHAFEVDEEICSRLNANAIRGMKFHAVAIGSKREKRPFYITNHPMCSSLYPPNHELISQFNNMEASFLKETTTVDTISIDEFADGEEIQEVDFIKIDIQGAELDAFSGAKRSLAGTVAIVTEVEFVPQYKNQPLFRDVDAYLDENGFMFHKFFTLRGRALSPVTVRNDRNYPSWHFLCDAMFVRRLADWESMDPARLLKLAILAYVYESPDICFRCLQIYDDMQQTQLHRFLLESNRLRNRIASIPRAMDIRGRVRKLFDRP
jgi:FkbM family methyltransferase